MGSVLVQQIENLRAAAETAIEDVRQVEGKKSAMAEELDQAAEYSLEWLSANQDRASLEEVTTRLEELEELSERYLHSTITADNHK